MATEASTPTPIVLPGKPRPRRVAAKTIRLCDKEHCKFVTRQPCVVCGRTPERGASHSPSPGRSATRLATNTPSHLPPSSPRTPSLRRRGLLVGSGQHRTPADRAQPFAHASGRSLADHTFPTPARTSWPSGSIVTPSISSLYIGNSHGNSSPLCDRLQVLLCGEGAKEAYDCSLA